MKVQSSLPLAASLVLSLALMISGCGKKGSQTSETPQNNPQQANSQPSNSAPVPPPPPPDQSQGGNPQAQSSGQPYSSGPVQPSGQPQPSGPVLTTRQAQPSLPPQEVVIPAGTHIRVRLDEDLGSRISEPGEGFGATLATPIYGNGVIVVPTGARVDGVVIYAKRRGRFRGRAVLELRLERVHLGSQSFHVMTSTLERVERGKGRRTAGFIGGGAGFGALLGGLAGGGGGALIGGLAGAGAGTAGAALTGNHDIFLPAETLLTFRLERPVAIE
jgi:hypothetical protein